MLARQLARSSAAVGRRHLHRTGAAFAKNDTSTIDSYKLPSQTSINEWEFKYDFVPKMSSPKIPPVTEQAVKQDIAQEKRAKVEKEMLDKELATSIKVEANLSAVVHGGEVVGTEPEFLQDRGSAPIDVSRPNAKGTQSSKPANRDKYVQSSINPGNSPDVSVLSQGEVDHKVASTEGQSQVLDDIEHTEHEESQKNGGQTKSGGVNWLLPIGFAGLGYFGYGYYQDQQKK